MLRDPLRRSVAWHFHTRFDGVRNAHAGTRTHARRQAQRPNEMGRERERDGGMGVREGRYRETEMEKEGGGREMVREGGGRRGRDRKSVV